MRVRSLRLEQFRNYDILRLYCGEHGNVLLGENGKGKTNLLEAISFACLTKSFFAVNERVVLRVEADWFEVEAQMVSDHGTEYLVRIVYDGASRQKTATINKAPVEPLSSIVGQFPVVILSPENSAITSGTPADRRKFVDLVISQMNRAYLEDLLEYRRVLRQRNKILFDAKVERRNFQHLLEPWDESLAQRGAHIMLRRRAFVEEFLPHMREAFQRLTRGEEEPAVSYLPSFSVEKKSSATDVKQSFAAALVRRREEELRLGTTLVGPHRDELDFTINNMELRKFASQGQHKTFQVALKLAEFEYLKEHRNETPIFLMDDVFSELDERRSHRLLGIIEHEGQVFITTADTRPFPRDYSWARMRRFIVHAGTVREDNTIEAARETAWHSR